MQNKVVSYAQNREDIILSAFFPKDYEGFYIDVGAHHPDNDTVTKFFYEKGWHGINIEPNRKMFEALERKRTRDINLNIGVADKDGTLTFREYLNGDGLSTFSKDVHEEYLDSPSSYTDAYTDHQIHVTTLKKIIAEYAPSKKIDFLKVDVEGFEFEVLNSNDWKEYRPTVLCVESNHVKRDWPKLLLHQQYELKFNDGFNDYYVDLLKPADFDYVDKAISKYTIYYQDYEQIQSLERAVETLGHEVDTLNYEIDLTRTNCQKILENTKVQIEVHTAEAARIRRFKPATVNFLRSLDNMLVARIDNLNKSKSLPSKKHYPIEVDISDMNKSELLRRARNNDIINFFAYTTPSNVDQIRILYGVTRSSYEFAKSQAKKSVKKILRAKRSIRRRK